MYPQNVPNKSGCLTWPRGRVGLLGNTADVRAYIFSQRNLEILGRTHFHVTAVLWLGFCCDTRAGLNPLTTVVALQCILTNASCSFSSSLTPPWLPSHEKWEEFCISSGSVTCLYVSLCSLPWRKLSVRANTICIVLLGCNKLKNMCTSPPPPITAL